MPVKNEEQLKASGFTQNPDGTWSKKPDAQVGKMILDSAVPVIHAIAGTHTPTSMSEMERRLIPKSEKVLQEQVANWLRQRNIWFCRSRMDRKTSNGLGTPDFLFAWPTCDNHHMPVGVECKSETGRLTDEQEKARCEMRECGWYHLTIRSLPELRELLEKL